MNPNFYPELNTYLEKCKQSYSDIPKERIALLEEIAKYINQQLSEDKEPNLVFICTHNSRRSHLSQLWAVTAARYHGFEKVQTFSAGTEATAVYPSVLNALEKAGFRISEEKQTQNSLFHIAYGTPYKKQVLFSKDLDHESLPKKNFAAIMTCSEADMSCPIVFGMDLRVKLFYVDPKEADGTSEEAIRYEERAFQIATEMMYLMSSVR